MSVKGTATEVRSVRTLSLKIGPSRAASRCAVSAAMSATSRAFAAIATASCTHLPSSCLRVAVGLQRSDPLLERLDGLGLRGFNLGETRFKRRFLGLESCLLGFEGRDPGLLLCEFLLTG